MTINKQLRKLALRYRQLPAKSHCLCAKYTVNWPHKIAPEQRMVCPRCGGRGYISKRREVLIDAYFMYRLNRYTCITLMAAVIVVSLLSVLI